MTSRPFYGWLVSNVEMCYYEKNILNSGKTMEKLNTEQNIDGTEKVQSVIEKAEKIDIAKTAIEECFDIVKSEYKIERNKKQSFENRAGFIITFLGVICVFLLGEVQLKEVFSLKTVSLTFLDFVKILSGLMVYACILFTMVMLIKTITIKPHANFDVRSINETLLEKERLTVLREIIFAYKKIIIQHRTQNELRAKDFRNSLYGLSATLIFIIIYITFK